MNSWDPWNDVTESGRTALSWYKSELQTMNRRVNLVARSGEDLDWHIRHCLCLSRMSFPDGARIVDFGTGGGLPAVPLAVRFPGIEVIAVDATEKKVFAVRTMARRCGVNNVSAWSGRAEDWSGPVYAAVSRATAPLAQLWSWTHANLLEHPGEIAAGCWKPGLLALKGGILDEEIRAHETAWPDTRVQVHSLASLAGPDFEGKYIVEVTPTAG